MNLGCLLIVTIFYSCVYFQLLQLSCNGGKWSATEVWCKESPVFESRDYFYKFCISPDDTKVVLCSHGQYQVHAFSGDFIDSIDIRLCNRCGVCLMVIQLLP